MTPIFTPVRTPGTGTAERGWLQSEATAVGAMALGVLVLHLATNAQYDFHRDSLYYMDSARHPAWGYVDYPPVTPTIARLSLWLFGPSVWGLRLWPTLCGAAMVVICYLIARELGAARFARLLAAAGAATSLVLLGANWLFQTVTFDQVVWLTALYLLARLVRTGDPRLWVAIGATLGVGLETKYTVIGLIIGVVAGTLLTRERRHLATPWPWIGLALMLLIFSPNVFWQVAHGWPSVEYTLNHKASQSVDFAPA
ncbi:MAG TPA: glycosyltransferase family 39 protein, partial [Chloroflexota bacterium]